MTPGGVDGLSSTSTKTPCTMLTPTVTELPRALEPVGRDTFIAAPDDAPTGRTRIALVASEPATIGGARRLVGSLAA
jgi:hypothetical protein